MGQAISTALKLGQRRPESIYWLVGLAAVAWVIAYSSIQSLADWLAYSALGLARYDLRDQHRAHILQP